MVKLILVLFLLIPMSLFAGPKEELESIGVKFTKYKSAYGIEEHARKCGFVFENQSKFIYSLLDAKNAAKLTCLKLADTDVKSDKSQEMQKMADLKNIRSVNWSLMSDAQKNKVIKFLLRNIR